MTCEGTNPLLPRPNPFTQLIVATDLRNKLEKFKAFSEESVAINDAPSLRPLIDKLQELILPAFFGSEPLRQQQETLIENLWQKATLLEELAKLDAIEEQERANTTVTIPVFSSISASSSITLSVQSSSTNSTDNTSTPLTEEEDSEKCAIERAQFMESWDLALKPYEESPLFHEMDQIHTLCCEEWREVESPYGEQDKKRFQEITRPYLQFLEKNPSMDTTIIQKKNEELTGQILKMIGDRSNRLKSVFASQKNIGISEALLRVKKEIGEAEETFSHKLNSYQKNLITKTEYQLVFIEYYQERCSAFEKLILEDIQEKLSEFTK